MFSFIFERTQTMARTAPSHQISFLYTFHMYSIFFGCSRCTRCMYRFCIGLCLYVCVWHICIYICGFADSSFVWFLCVWICETLMYNVRCTNAIYQTKQKISAFYFCKYIKSNFIKNFCRKIYKEGLEKKKQKIEKCYTKIQGTKWRQ